MIAERLLPESHCMWIPEEERVGGHDLCSQAADREEQRAC